MPILYKAIWRLANQSIVLFFVVFQSCMFNKKQKKDLPNCVSSCVVPVPVAAPTGDTSDSKMSSDSGKPGSETTQDIAMLATLTPLSVNHFSHKESKWELNITSTLDHDLNYKVMAIQLKQGMLKSNGTELKAGDQLALGKQELIFVPNGFVGKFSPIIVIQDSNLVMTTVPLKGPTSAYQFKDADFFAKAVCMQTIDLTVGGKHLLGDEEWLLEDWSFQGGLTGNLYDQFNGHQILKKSKLKAGTTHISWDKHIQTLSGTPIVVFSIVHPDGKKEAIQVNISSMVLPILEAKLTECTTLLSDLIGPETDLHKRKEIIDQSKAIMTQMGYLLGEEEKIKVASIIDAYRSFLKENKAAFNQSIHVSQLVSSAASSIIRASKFTDHTESICSLRQDQQAITSLLKKVHSDPSAFVHLHELIGSIKWYADNIDKEINRLETNKQQHECNLSQTIKNELEKALENLAQSKAEKTNMIKKLLVASHPTKEQQKVFAANLIRKDEVEVLDTIFDEIEGECMEAYQNYNQTCYRRYKLINYAIHHQSKRVLNYLSDKEFILDKEVVYNYIKSDQSLDHAIIEILFSKGYLSDDFTGPISYHKDFIQNKTKYSTLCSDYSCSAVETTIPPLHLCFLFQKMEAYHFLLEQGVDPYRLMTIRWKCGETSWFNISDLKH